MKHSLAAFVLVLGFASSLPAQVFLEDDFEADVPGQQPAVSGVTFSPSSNTATNGAVVLDATTSPANPLTGQSLYVYDLNGDGSSGEPTHMRFPFNGGVNVSNVRVDFDFQRAYAPASPDDSDTRIQVAVGRAGDTLNNSDFRPFELRLQNRGKIQLNSRDGTSTVADFLTDAPNSLTLLLNSHDTDSVAYDDTVLGSGTLAPNTVALFLNGTLIGTYPFHQTPDPTNAPQIDFYAENNDLGQIAFYQDSKRQGGIVFDNLKISALEAATPPPPSETYFTTDFESDVPGQQPAVSGATFSPSSNTATNGAVVLDATTTPANPLTGQSLYVYDLNGDGSSGEPTHMRFPFNGGVNVSNVRVDFDFQRAYAPASPDDSDTRIQVAVGRAGDTLNNSDFRPFELRLQNRGKIQLNSRDGTSTVADFLTDAPNSLTLLLNSHDTDSMAYDDTVLGSGTLAPNTVALFLNGTLIGTYPFHQTPDPTNAPQIDFYAENNDLGQIAFYQDSKRQGGIVFDNLKISALEAATPPPPSETFFTADFEADTVGAQPEGGYTFSPSSNTATNGAQVIDATSTPANPLPGQSLYLYDLSGDLSTGDPTHVRAPFNGGANVSDVRVDFDFQRAFASASPDDTDTRFHFAVARAADRLNNSDFRPFEIRILNNGDLVVNSIAGSQTAGSYLTDTPNHLTLLINSHDANSVDYDDPDLGAGTVGPNSLEVFLNNTSLGAFTFHQTPDPANAPQIDFYAENNDLGQFAFYQDSKRQGAIVVDNLVIRRLAAAVASLPAPTDLTATADSAVQVSLSWTDNADAEAAYVVERKTGTGEYEVIAELPADSQAYVDTTVSPETSYTYRVKATATAVESDPSNESSATTPEQVAPLITGTETPELVIDGAETTVTVTAIGREPVSYQWYRGQSGDTADPIAGATSATLTLTPGPGTTQVWVRVSNTSGSVDGETIALDAHTPTSTVVANETELEAAIAAAGPGDQILLKDGVWNDLVIHLTGTGTEAFPITLGAETPGKVTLRGGSRAEIGGTWLVLRDLVFEGPYSGNDDEVIQFRRGSGNIAHHCRVTNVSIVDYVPVDGSKMSYVSFYGTYNRLDHSYLKGHDVIGVTVVVWLDGQPNYHRIDHNHFADRISGGGENGWETIRVGTSTNSMTDSRTIVEDNLFTRCNGEIEIISNKSNENIYRRNTFEWCEGTLTLRHGNRCTVDSNYFLGYGFPNTGGVRVIGEDHTVINNYFEGTTARDGAAITVYAGVPNSPLNEYFAAHRATIAHNTFVNNIGPLIEIAAGFGERDRTVLPEDVTVANNLMVAPDRGTGAFVIGENPTDQTWLNNIIHGGAAGIDVPGGFIDADPALMVDVLRQISVPAAGSPVIDAGSGAVSVALDIEGRNRDAVADVGAHEVSSTDVSMDPRPISAAETGPAYLASSRVLGEPNARVVNGSVRARSDSADAALINGFVVAGTHLKSVLVRGMGPGLAQFGVTDPMPAPTLKLFDAGGTLVAANTDWQTGDADELVEATAFAGAFELQDGVPDSAVVEILAPGAYTAQVLPSNGVGGVVLAEVYDLTEGNGTVVNQSVRGEIREGQEVLIGGFAIAGNSPRRALIRCAGPALADYGVTAPVADPMVSLLDGTNAEIAANDNWSAGTDTAAIEAAAAEVGAFPFGPGSLDAAVLVTLQPGLYSIHGSGVGGATGTALVEVYLLND